MTNRRSFILGAAAMAMTGPASAQKSVPLGLELYTVRQDLEKDYDRTMQKVRDFGIRHVQATLTQSGKTSREQKKLYDGLGISWKSIHAEGYDLREAALETIDEAKSVGITNITCSFPLYPVGFDTFTALPTLDDWKNNADTFNELGALCQKFGISFAYHNHNVEFRKVGDVLPYDLLLKETDPALVQMEMDIGWMVAAGADPVAYLTKYANRYHSLHIKDLKNKGIPNNKMKMISAVIGKGIVDWKTVLAAAHKTEVERAFLEIEEPYDPSPLEMVKQSFDYLHGHV